MSNNSPTIALIVFAAFSFAFIGVLLTMSFVLDRRRVKDVHSFIPERSEGALDHPNPPSLRSEGVDDPPEDQHDHDHQNSHEQTAVEHRHDVA